jgi:hypothetical protein
LTQRQIPCLTPNPRTRRAVRRHALTDRGFGTGPGRAPWTATGAPAVDATGKLRYDSAAGQYVYTWQTDKASAGTCARFSVTLVDGTTHEAYYKFTM